MMDENLTISGENIGNHDFGDGLYCFRGNFPAASSFAVDRSWPLQYNSDIGLSHRIANNMISRNGGDGIYLGLGVPSHTTHVVNKNTVTNNGENGIFLRSSATGNMIRSHNSSGFFDMNMEGTVPADVDDDSYYNENVWMRNSFDTANQDCIRD